MRRFDGRIGRRMTTAAVLALSLGLIVGATAAVRDASVRRESVPPGSVPPELGPIGTQSVVAGRRWKLYIRGRDADGEPPQLIAHDLPPGATLAPSRKGWYVLDWTPPADLVGSFRVTVEAIDARVPTWRTERIVPLEVVADPSLPRIAPVPGQIVSAGIAVRFGIEASLEDGRVPLVSIAPMPPGATLDMHTDGTYVFQWQTDEGDRGEYRLNVTARHPDRDMGGSSMDVLLIVGGYSSREPLAPNGTGAEPIGVAQQDYGYGTGEDPAEYVVEDEIHLVQDEDYFAQSEGYVVEDDTSFDPNGGTGGGPESVEDAGGVVYDANGYPVDADGKPVDPNSLY